VDRVYALLPELRAAIPPAIDITPAVDRSITIRTSLKEVERTLFISVVLVILVVFLFLRSGRATLVPSIAVPVSLIGTFAAMYMLGYSLDNLSLMALTVATGFVVDDAIVVLENISRHIEAGVPRIHAAIRGSGELAFTLMSMIFSLIVVLIPILLMGGIVGRLFREFAMTLSVAIMISLAVSLTTTPMMCAYLLADRREQAHGRLYWASERAFTGILSLYDRSLRRALQWPSLVVLSLLATLCLGIYLVKIVPKGFFPTQDIGLMFGGIQADQSISFQLMEQKLTRFVDIIRHDPAVQSVSAFTGGGQTNSGFVFVVLKPLSERKVPMQQVMGRLRPKFNEVSGARLFLQGAQDIRAGGRANNAQYQYTLQGDDAGEIYDWAPKLEAALQKLPLLTDVNLDQQQKGLETELILDRTTAARFGLTVSQIDNTLYDAFGQRQVSVIYAAQNQYHVIMEVAPEFWQNPETLSQIYVSTSGGAVGGTKATNALAGTVLAKVPAANSTSAATSTAQIAGDTARNLANNSLANTGHGPTSTGTPVSTAHETMV